MNDAPRRSALLAEFDTPEALQQAAARVHELGYRRMDAYSPIPVEGLAETLGFKHSGMARMVLLGAVVGGVLGYAMQYWIHVWAYPLNIGGRPLHSWPAFIPVTFELTILGGALAAILGMLALNGLPRPHHPLFEVDAFARASRDRYFLSIDVSDRQFDEFRTPDQLRAAGAMEVHDVPLPP